MPFASLIGLTRTYCSTPCLVSTIISSPGFIPASRRMLSGITTWYLLETLAVEVDAISVIKWPFGISAAPPGFFELGPAAGRRISALNFNEGVDEVLSGKHHIVGALGPKQRSWVAGLLASGFVIGLLFLSSATAVTSGAPGIPNGTSGSLSMSSSTTTATETVTLMCSASPQTQQVGLPVKFTATASGADFVSFSWNFADNSAYGSGNPVNHTYSRTGTLTVTVTAKTAPGPNQITAGASCPVNIIPKYLNVGVSVIPMTGPSPLVFNVTIKISNGVAPYNIYIALSDWQGQVVSSSNGSINSNSYTTLWRVTPPGMYMLYVKVTDARGATFSTNISFIEVFQPPPNPGPPFAKPL